MARDATGGARVARPPLRAVLIPLGCVLVALVAFALRVGSEASGLAWALRPLRWPAWLALGAAAVGVALLAVLFGARRGGLRVPWVAGAAWASLPVILGAADLALRLAAAAEVTPSHERFAALANAYAFGARTAWLGALLGGAQLASTALLALAERRVLPALRALDALGAFATAGALVGLGLVLFERGAFAGRLPEGIVDFSGGWMEPRLSLAHAERAQELALPFALALGSSALVAAAVALWRARATALLRLTLHAALALMLLGTLEQTRRSAESALVEPSRAPWAAEPGFEPMRFDPRRFEFVVVRGPALEALPGEPVVVPASGALPDERSLRRRFAEQWRRSEPITLALDRRAPARAIQRVLDALAAEGPRRGRSSVGFFGASDRPPIPSLEDLPRAGLPIGTLWFGPCDDLDWRHAPSPGWDRRLHGSAARAPRVFARVPAGTPAEEALELVAGLGDRVWWCAPSVDGEVRLAAGLDIREEDASDFAHTLNRLLDAAYACWDHALERPLGRVVRHPFLLLREVRYVELRDASSAFDACLAHVLYWMPLPETEWGVQLIYPLAFGDADPRGSPVDPRTGAPR
ncbi:MAG TPA: hypothetical protein RMH85_29500 [Polyangiaceae bacterium LLY-WYZ-15_(1-7)]|nr:hypothetical protein [Myxococcales bacterium]MAT28940.1 hypothetical protein [Sandaracinus sp.]HJK93449.1 hypothetical protein [Polyangiaceae bacterium LLY-WYZ-15_(1-7)]MBJ74163.1 hypothetical protein [Sandaracinus sp.]HJL02671.1 hypothetical protein [Polyangiaceae bacterium LLY-WYZ-15_(1-7)]